MTPILAVRSTARRGRRAFCARVAVALVAVGTAAACGGDDDEATGEGPVGPSPQDAEGSVRIVPDDPVVASSRGSWVVEWVAGPSGLPEGGGVVLQVSPFWNWSPPQVRRPGFPGYTTAACSAEGVEVEIYEGGVPMTVVARPAGGALAPGDTLRFCYGDSSHGGVGSLSRADSYAEDFEELLIKTDGDGDGWFEAVAEQPTLEILPGAAVTLAVAARNVVDPGEELEVRVFGLDRQGNRAKLPVGQLALVLRPLAIAPGATPDPPDTLASWRVAPSESSAVRRIGVERPGLYRLEAFLTTPDGALAGRNDLVLVERDSPFRDILWGDIHSHSALSDGTGAPADLYAFARDVAGLDVCSVTDHDAHGLFPLTERGGWEAVRRATQAAHEPGRFVTLLGYEWTSWTWGHRNVYYPGSEGDVFDFRSPESDTPEKLWARIAPFGGLTIPHHPAGGPIAVDWSVPSDEERERVVEICSIHGSSEFPGAERAIYRPVEGAFVRDAFNLGHRLGIVASGDTHDGHPGMRSVGSSTNGLAAFRAGHRTRDAVLSAIRQRRVYGTSGARILLAGRWGENEPGATLDRRPEDPLVVEVIAPEPIELVEVIGPDGSVETVYGGGRRVTRSFAAVSSGPPAAWLYVRVVLADGEVAWDSPYWLEEPAS